MAREATRGGFEHRSSMPVAVSTGQAFEVDVTGTIGAVGVEESADPARSTRSRPALGSGAADRLRRGEPRSTLERRREKRDEHANAANDTAGLFGQRAAGGRRRRRAAR
jgi:hypothetical protein